MKYFLGSLVGVNIMLIWFFGILITDHELRLRSLEIRQVHLEAAVDVGINEISRAAKDVRKAAKEIRGE